MIDEARTLRRRHDELTEDAERHFGHGDGGSVSLLVQTATKTTYPTSAGAYYYCEAVTATGTESEGSSGTLTADSSSTLYVFNVGSAVPPVGTNLVATFEDYRWVFRYDG